MTYRHTIHRHLPLAEGETRRWLGVTMLNPSTASPFVNGDNDNTIRSLLRIADYNEFTGLMVCNVSPFIATDPKDLFAAIDAGVDVFDRTENDIALAALAGACEAVVCAWGATPLKHRALDRRASEVRALLLEAKGALHCLGKTKEGWPKHPCRLGTETPIRMFATKGDQR